VPFLTSRYNFSMALETGEILLFSTFSGATINLSGSDSRELAESGCRYPSEVDCERVDDGLKAQLLEGGFIALDERGQLDEIRDRYQSARSSYPLVLTLTTTMDCNLGCYYCYEQRSQEALGLHDVQSVVNLARLRLAKTNKRHLHIDWYGGEPLLNLSFIEAASSSLQILATEVGVGYSASLVSNGTCWPQDPGAFVARHKIRQVQISFDGLREHHNRRRRFTKQSDTGRSSFDIAVAVVDELVDHVQVDIRFNIDNLNKQDVLPFVSFARERGWFSSKHAARFQPARLAAYTEHSGFLRKAELSLAEYDHIRSEVRKFLTEVEVPEPEAPDGFPYPRTLVCAALADEPIVIGPDKLLYRCGLQVSEKHRAVGNLRGTADSPFRILGQDTQGSSTLLSGEKSLPRPKLLIRKVLSGAGAGNDLNSI